MSAGTRRPGPAGRLRRGLAWQPLRWPAEGLAAIPGLDLGSDPGRGRVIVVRATPGAREGGWAACAAVQIAGAGVARGARVLLADLFLDQPQLHEAFGARNLEGVADVIAYGASLRRVARAAGDGACRVATAGTPVADARAVLDQPRWHDLVERVVGDGVTLVIYQPAESVVHPGGSPSIVLARKGEPMTALGATGLTDVVAVVGPPAGAAATAGLSDGRTLGEQRYRASLWDEVEAGEEPPAPEPARPPAGEAAESSAVEPAALSAVRSAAPSAVEPTPPSVAGPEPAPAAEASIVAESGKDAEPGAVSRAAGRGLSVSAFVVLVLFAVAMILMGINNAGIADVPGADRLWRLFEGLLARISRFFTR